MSKCNICDSPLPVQYVGLNSQGRPTFEFNEGPFTMAFMEEHIKHSHPDLAEQMGLKHKEAEVEDAE